MVPTFSILNRSLAWPVGRELFWINFHMSSLHAGTFFCVAALRTVHKLFYTNLELYVDIN